MITAAATRLRKELEDSRAVKPSAGRAAGISAAYVQGTSVAMLIDRCSDVLVKGRNSSRNARRSPTAHVVLDFGAKLRLAPLSPERYDMGMDRCQMLSEER